MNTTECEVAVIGAGSAGMAAYSAASKAGRRVLLIESAHPGTTCARVGCMPSKLLIAAAEVAHCAATSSVFGIQTAPIRIDGRAVMTRVRRERDRFVVAVMRSYESIPADRRLLGFARFIDANTLQVGDHTRVAAKTIIIATGSRPAIPEGFDAVGDRVLTNDNLFELAELPTSVAVIGAGALGLELGQALHRLGTQVNLFDKGLSIGGLRSDEMNASAARMFGESLSLRLGVETRAEAAAGGGVRLHWKGDKDAGSASFSHVLIAAGRPPNLQGLELARTGIVMDDHGTPVFNRHTMRCGSSSIFIAGDADSDRAVLHEASDEGRIAGLNAAAFPGVVEHPRRTPMAVTFSDPQVAVVGRVDAGDQVTGRVDFADQGRAKVMHKACGHINLYADSKTGRISGAEMIGPGVEHLAHLVAWAVQLELPARGLLYLPFYHPTVEEGLRTALRDLCAHLPVEPLTPVTAMEYGPGI